jgi:Flp pilus assembly protein TadD
MKKIYLNSLEPSQQQLDDLLEYYQTKQYADAEKLSLSITQEFPEHPFAWKVLAVVLKLTERISESLVASQKSVQLDPQDIEAHSNLGVLLKELGRLKEAEASLRQAITLKPDYAEAHNSLGIILKEQGRLEEAEVSLGQATTLKPDLAEAHNNLGNTLKELGRLEEAETSYRQAITLKPDFAEAHNNLGNTLKELGRLKEAEVSYRQAITLKPDFAEAHNNLGNTLKEQGRLDEAEVSLRQAIALKPDYAGAHNNLGVILQELGRLEEAEVSCRKAITLKPDNAEARNNLGILLQGLGRLKEAEASYRQAIALKPDYAEAHRNLTSIKKFDTQDEQYSKMQELYLDKNISEEQRCYINFGLAKACEDLGDLEKAFQHYREGNVLRKKLLNYDINQDVELFKQIKFTYPRIKQNSLAPEKLSKNLMPIFIVGMPRSGTTLVEQIISSHSEVTGAGELSFVKEFGEPIARGLSNPNTDALLEFRERYLFKLQSVSNGNLIVTDKMTQNFRYIGLLAAAFPEAKIVHVKRNPAAVCWSNYKNCFVSKGIGYSYAIDDVISYHKLYESLMVFWTNTLSKRIYNLDYEQLTVNQESETRQLIDYLDLDWDEKCLSPQNNKRHIATASNVQIRKKVYQGSSGQWKKYQPFLNGALDGLMSP